MQHSHKIVSIITILLLFSAGVFAQTKPRNQSVKNVRASEEREVQTDSGSDSTSSRLSKNPVTVNAEKVEQLATDVKGGSVVVRITSNGNAIEKIGLAQRGVSIIEFLAADPVYRIYPGNEDYVTVDCGETDANGGCLNYPNDSIVLRPGKLFNVWSEAENAATVITVQRVSGIVVSFVVIPVRSIMENAFHIVVRYDLGEVISRRKELGLPYNLSQNQVSVAALKDGILPKNENSENGETESGEQAKKTEFKEADYSGENNTVSKIESYENLALAELVKVARSNEKLEFLKPVHNLSLAVSRKSSRVSDTTVEVVAIRNTSDKSLRLVPDQPDLYVESVDDKKKIASSRVPVLYVATTIGDDEILLPGEVYYCAFVYKMPILGVRQIMSVAFAHREAADEPAKATLLGLIR